MFSSLKFIALFVFIPLGLVNAQKQKFKKVIDTNKYGKILSEGYTYHGEKVGYWKYWYTNGKEEKEVFYKLNPNFIHIYDSINYDSLCKLYNINQNAVTYEKLSIDTVQGTNNGDTILVPVLSGSGLCLIEYDTNNMVISKTFWNTVNDSMVLFKTFDEKGNISCSETYMHGLLNGKICCYYQGSKIVRFEDNYVDGYHEGESRYFSPSGKLCKIVYFHHGHEISTKVLNNDCN